MSVYLICVLSVLFIISLIAILVGWNFATNVENLLTTVQRSVTWIFVIPSLILSVVLLFILPEKYQLSGVGNLVTLSGYFLVLSTVAKKFRVRWGLAKILNVAALLSAGLAPLYLLYYGITMDAIGLFDDVPATSLSVAVIAVMVLGEVLGTETDGTVTTESTESNK
ncbi:hypothetical protein [Cytobacillus oceanisediminis]|uniref:hypothetical protein n=1 Tax=Cytobacillus oceanisediminis TaxID=665099 RepID=UPI00203DC258|nr:hypothetical protein [Cytobacillus oceanisediminis]MCM3393130.1 hypothetical protein [Cytobacillus oceanisediminis]